MINEFYSIINNYNYLLIWMVVDLLCVALTIRDIAVRNAHLMPLMKIVWTLTVAYSGPFGLAIYWISGRKEIPDDAPWRRAFRSVAHCYSGCGLGEIIGVIIAAGLLSLGNFGISVTTFILAYVVGFALTIGPLVQDGVGFRTATWDALLSETPSIAVMEMVAIGADLLISGGAGMAEPLFWSGLIISLTLGLVAAYPVNLLLIHHGVKEGMMDPRQTQPTAAS